MKFPRLDHLAFRVADRAATVDWLVRALGYKIQKTDTGGDTFQIYFNDEKTETATCSALEPPDTPTDGAWLSLIAPIIPSKLGTHAHNGEAAEIVVDYHRPPEIFVSEGSPGSIVHDWVQKRGGVGGLHHIAVQVPSVRDAMIEWRDKGLAEFTTDDPLQCPGLTQVFTKPSKLFGVVIEFIERGKYGFCVQNVEALMNSTRGD